MGVAKRFGVCLVVFLVPLLLSGCAGSSSITPFKQGFSVHSEEKHDGLCKGGLKGNGENYAESQDGIAVGWEHVGINSEDCLENITHIYRGGIVFTLLPIAPPKINLTKATLTWQFLGGENIDKDGVAFLFNTSCTERLGIATASWNQGDDTIPADFFMSLPAVKFTPSPPLLTYSVDVTKQVQDWKDGKKNYGFVFAAAKEEKGFPPDRAMCWTALGRFKLILETK